MRSYWNIFMLFVHRGLWRVLLALLILVLAGSIMFYIAMQNVLNGDSSAWQLWAVIRQSRLSLLFQLMFLVVTALVARAGTSHSIKTDYTLRRLGVSDFGVFLCQACFGAAAYLLLWLVQALTAYGFCLYYRQVAEPSWVTNQSLLLQIYRSEYLFSLIPLESVGGWIKNISICAAMGLVCARDAYCQRRGKASVGLYILMYCNVRMFFDALGSVGRILVPVVNVIAGAILVFLMYVEEDKIDACN